MISPGCCFPAPLHIGSQRPHRFDETSTKRCVEPAGWLVRRRAAQLTLHLRPTLLSLTPSPQCEAHWRQRRAARRIPRQRRRCLTSTWRALRRRDWRRGASATRRPPIIRCMANSECRSPGDCACHHGPSSPRTILSTAASLTTLDMHNVCLGEAEGGRAQDFWDSSHTVSCAAYQLMSCPITAAGGADAELRAQRRQRAPVRGVCRRRGGRPPLRRRRHCCRRRRCRR